MVETFAFNVNGVSKTYVGRRSAVAAVDGVDLHVAKGQFVAICGQSGSGKSTLLALVGGLCRPTAGSVTVGESDLGQLTPSGLADFRGRQVGFVFQFSSLLPNLRAIDNVALAALLQTGGGYPRAYAAARACLAEVGLANRETAFPRELSGGQQRRVAIARALVNRPGLLLADEPTSDLDEQTAEEIFALLRRVQQAHGATLVLVTHDTRLARSADRLIYLHQGRIVEDLVPDRVDARLQPIERVAWPPPLHEASPSACSPADEPIQPLGAGLGRFVIDFLGWTFAVTLAIFAINHLTAGFQQRTVSREQDSRRQIEELAFRGMRSNVEDLVEQSDGSFLLTLSLENLAAERPIYFMSPAPRIFVQVDQAWQGLPLVAADLPSDKVERLEGRRQFGFRFRADRDRFDELLKGYEHLRFTISILVADSATPGENVFERTDDYYVYLRPSRISEAEVRTRNGWKPDAIVPRWIPMPSH